MIIVIHNTVVPQTAGDEGAVHLTGDAAQHVWDLGFRVYLGRQATMVRLTSKEIPVSEVPSTPHIRPSPSSAAVAWVSGFKI